MVSPNGSDVKRHDIVFEDGSRYPLEELAAQNQIRILTERLDAHNVALVHLLALYVELNVRLKQLEETNDKRN
jgi:hypothetical protein